MRVSLLEITFLSPDFHELWCKVMCIRLFTEVMGYVGIGMVDHFSALLFLMTLWLVPLDCNPFWLCSGPYCSAHTDNFVAPLDQKNFSLV